MPRHLQAPGKSGARLHFDRTQVVYRHKEHVHVIPLDQVDHVEGGREPGPAAFAVLAAFAVILGAAAYWFRALSPLVPDVVWLLAGLLLAAALIAGQYLRSAAVVRIDSARGSIAMRLPRSQVAQTTTFVRHLLRTRTIFLEGVYETDPDDPDTPWSGDVQEPDEGPAGTDEPGRPGEYIEGEEPESTDEES